MRMYGLISLISTLSSSETVLAKDIYNTRTPFSSETVTTIDNANTFSSEAALSSDNAKQFL